MSADNERVVRSYLEEVPGKDGAIRNLELIRRRLADYWDRDGDYYPVRKFPEARPCHSIEEIGRFFTEFLGPWEHYELDVLEVRAIDDQRVFAMGRMSAQGRGSGLDIEGEIYACCWLRAGKLFRVEDHLTRKGALEALGLSDWTDNEAVYRRALASFDLGDREAWLADRAEDCVVITSAGWPESATIRGRDATWDFYVDVIRAFSPRAWADTVEVVAAGADKLLVHQRGDDIRGAASGAEVDWDYWVVVTFREGKIVRDEWFRDGAEARAAAGLAGGG